MSYSLYRNDLLKEEESSYICFGNLFKIDDGCTYFSGYPVRLGFDHWNGQTIEIGCQEFSLPDVFCFLCEFFDYDDIEGYFLTETIYNSDGDTASMILKSGKLYISELDKAWKLTTQDKKILWSILKKCADILGYDL